jgi:hypothetical protein
MALSMYFPLTMSARELGNSFLILGGRPISKAFKKSWEYTAVDCVMASPLYIHAKNRVKAANPLRAPAKHNDDNRSFRTDDITSPLGIQDAEE